MLLQVIGGADRRSFLFAQRRGRNGTKIKHWIYRRMGRVY